MLLFADYLQNPHETPLKDVALWIQGSEIKFIGRRDALPPEAKQDSEQYQLQNAALFPGLVNAHCHLELTDLEGLIYPGNFVAWIRRVLQSKNNPQAEPSSKTLQKGILKSIMGGSTTLGDHISCTSELAVLLQSPLRGRAFLEILGVVPEVAEEILRASNTLTQELEKTSSRWTLHPSPHSVHALAPEILERVLAQSYGIFSIHLSESQDEAEYFASSSGKMAQLISERGKNLKRLYSSALFELKEKNLLSDNIIAIHGNHFSEAELKLCAANNISVVHCPLSHDYFGHCDFPMGLALKNGVNVALGTDSLASAASLSMLDVLRATQRKFPTLTQEQIFAMATLNGAQALKLSDQVGILEVGKKADILGIRLPETTLENSPLNGLFLASQADFVMIDGKILVG